MTNLQFCNYCRLPNEFSFKMFNPWKYNFNVNIGYIIFYVIIVGLGVYHDLLLFDQ